MAATWTNARKVVCFGSGERKCPLCGAAEETDWHRIYECSFFDIASSPRHGKLNKMAMRPRCRDFPAIWLRGLAPLDWTTPAEPASNSVPPTYEIGLAIGGNKLEGADGIPLVGFGDGSGGPRSSNQRLRRASWGWLVLDGEVASADLNVKAGRLGGLPGDRQRGGRAELFCHGGLRGSHAGRHCLRDGL